MTDRITRLAVIVAMSSELQHLPDLPALPKISDSPWPGVSWRHGTLEVTALLSGIGMVRAAAATEAALLTHGPDAVLNFGCAGSHRRDMRVGDVVIGIGSVPHGSMVIAPDGTTRFRVFGGTGAPGSSAGGIPTDPDLLGIVREAAAGWAPDPWRGVSGDNPAPRVHEGVVASADVWTQSHVGIDLLAERHQSMCEDMEAAAIATVCALHRMPFMTIKDISNNELLHTTIFESAIEHLPEAELGRRAAALTSRVIDAIAARLVTAGGTVVRDEESTASRSARYGLAEASSVKTGRVTTMIPACGSTS